MVVAFAQQKVIHNGVDCEFWNHCGGPRRRRAVWFGRVHPDKGTHLAIDAAHRAGLPIDVVGPASDQAYYSKFVAPRLKADDVYHGLRSHKEICRIVGSASVALATPCWDEPFGLVVAEALACGTPVAGFARGALPELLPSPVGPRGRARGRRSIVSCRRGLSVALQRRLSSSMLESDFRCRQW